MSKYDATEMTPFNRILILEMVEEDDGSKVKLPHDMKEKKLQNERGYYRVIKTADDLEIDVGPGDIVMAQNVSVKELKEMDGTQYYFVKDNYIIGKLEG